MTYLYIFGFFNNQLITIPMLRALPNPTKSLQIEMPVSIVSASIEHLPLYTQKYKLTKANPVMKQFTFEASEFLSLGVFIDVNYFVVNENRTEVKLEVRRKIGTFDQAHEISNANRHIEEITELLSKSLTSDPTIRLAEIKASKEAANAKQQALKIAMQNEKENSPGTYYAKQAVIILISIGLLAGTIYLVYWFFSR